VLSVEQSLKDGAYDAAATKLQLLPKQSTLFSWNDSKVPSALRQSYSDARDLARKAWDRGLSDVFSLKPGEPADIKFGFEPKLANAPGTESPAGLATFVSETTLPRLESVPGLIRGSDLRSSSAVDVQNDVAYSIGVYLGVADRPIPTTSMARTDAFSFAPNIVTGAEISIARRNLEAVAILRRAVHAKIRLEPAQPKAALDPLSLTYGPVIQGKTAYVPLLITNIGQGELSYFVMPSCSCITAGPEGVLKPNEAKLVEISVDTTQWTKTLNKKLMVLTNDPDDPVRIVPIEVKVTPRYRWIVPGGQTRLVGDSGADVDLYLEIPFGSEIYATGVRFEGVPATAAVEPWSGSIADPDDGEGVKPRDGYHVKLHVKGGIEGGRQLGSLVLSTTSTQFPEISYNFAFQTGILPMPDNLNLGLISDASKAFYILLTRPQKPFRVLSVDTSSKTLQAKVAKVAGTSDYRVEVRVAGKMIPGDYAAVIHIYTDDPRQGKIDVPVRGTVE
jgi:hypothetical protein